MNIIKKETDFYRNFICESPPKTQESPKKRSGKKVVRREENEPDVEERVLI